MSPDPKDTQSQISRKTGAKYHHYVSQLLLRAFAKPATDSGKLYTFDKRRMKSWERKPDRTGGASHHNTVDEKTNPNPLAWEEALSKIESLAAPIIDGMRVTGSLPTRMDFVPVVGLMASLHAGSPRARRKLEGVFLELAEREILAYAKSDESRREFTARQEAIAREAKEKGLASAEQLEQFARESPEQYIEHLKKFTVTTDQSWKIAASVNTTPAVAAALGARHWSLIRIPDDSADLIIGDSPVGFACADGDGPQEVGLRHPRAVVYLPISPRMALLSWFSKPLRPFVPNGGTAARLNAIQFACALEQCYSGNDDFSIYRPDGGPGAWSAMIAAGELFQGIEDRRCDKADEYTQRPGDH